MPSGAGMAAVGTAGGDQRIFKLPLVRSRSLARAARAAAGAAASPAAYQLSANVHSLVIWIGHDSIFSLRLFGDALKLYIRGPGQPLQPSQLPRRLRLQAASAAAYDS